MRLPRFARAGVTLSVALCGGVHLRGFCGDFIAELQREIAHGTKVIRERVHTLHTVCEAWLLG